MNSHSAIILAAALSLACYGSNAWAQPASDVSLDPRYQRGRLLRRQEQDAEALQLFQTLYAETRQPLLLGEIGLAEGALQRWLDAEQHLVEALTISDPAITREGHRFDEGLTFVRSHLGYLEVMCAAPGATVWVDGREIGVVGVPLRVPAGTLTFEVRAEGYLPEPRTVTIVSSGRGRVRETVDLAPIANSSALPSTTTRHPARSSHSSAPWIVGGLGVVAVGIGAGYLVWAQSASDDARVLCPDGCATEDDARRVDVLNQQHSDRVGVGVALTVAGGVGIAASAVWLLLRSRPSTRSAQLLPSTSGLIVRF